MLINSNYRNFNVCFGKNEDKLDPKKQERTGYSWSSQCNVDYYDGIGKTLSNVGSNYASENLTKGNELIFRVLPTVVALVKTPDGDPKEVARLDVDFARDNKSQAKEFIEEINEKVRKDMPENAFNHIKAVGFRIDDFKKEVKKAGETGKNFDYRDRYYTNGLGAKFIFNAKANPDGSMNIKMKVTPEGKNEYKADLILTKDDEICNPDKSDMNENEHRAADLLFEFIRA